MERCAGRSCCARPGRRATSFPRVDPTIPSRGLLGAYVAAAAASYLVSDPMAGSSAGDLAGVFGLALLAVLTADFASDAQAFRLIVWVVTATSLLTAAAAILGLALFYAGVDTSLVGIYGALVPSGECAHPGGLRLPAVARQLLHLRVGGCRAGRRGDLGTAASRDADRTRREPCCPPFHAPSWASRSPS